LRRHLTSAAPLFEPQELQASIEAARGKPVQERTELAVKLAESLGVVLGKRDSSILMGSTSYEFNLVYPFAGGGGARLGMLTALVKGKEGYLYGANCDPALPLATAGAPLVERAVRHLREECGVLGPIKGVSRLPGLCAHLVATEGWRDALVVAKLENPGASDEEAEAMVASIEAIARGRPRPGHSVLGQGTFRAAEAGCGQQNIF